MPPRRNPSVATLPTEQANRHDALRLLLRRLNLGYMSRNFADVALHAAKEGVTHETFLYELVRLECEQRDHRRIERRRRLSGLPADKTFRTLQLGRFPPSLRLQIERLRAGAFVHEAVNVIALGRPGAGKSHIAAALGEELLLLGHAVLWSTTTALVQRLLAAKRDLRLPQELARLERFACVILDDIGYVQQDRDEMEVLFTFLADRYEHQSVIITTNLVFSEWDRIFKDPMTTMAAIDRVVHHSVILDLMALDSYRVEEAQQRRPATSLPTPAEHAPNVT